MSFESLGVASVACITVICYLAALAIKQTPLANKWLPTICGVLGALLGLAGHYGGMVDFPAADPLTALSDETCRRFSEGRSSQVTDVWLDSAGVLAGSLVAIVLLLACEGLYYHMKRRHE